MKTAVVLFNLGGPTDEKAIKPFLYNLFSDPAIISLPGVLRNVLARYIANRREPKAKEIYSYLGGKSPLLKNTMKQAELLEKDLGQGFKVFICMRYWQPRAQEVIEKIKEYMPHKLVLLPLYPQFSTTTTKSSFAEFYKHLEADLPDLEHKAIDSYPEEKGFIGAQVELIKHAVAKAKDPYRILFTAHGIPLRTVRKGDPYAQHIDQTVQAIVRELKIPQLDYQTCFQSRLGPLVWLQPYTENEIRRAGNDGVSVILVPISFVSENSETLVELDILYLKLAHACGVREYIRVPTVSGSTLFIQGLAGLVRNAVLV